MEKILQEAAALSQQFIGAPEKQMMVLRGIFFKGAAAAAGSLISSDDLSPEQIRHLISLMSSCSSEAIAAFRAAV